MSTSITAFYRQHLTSVVILLAGLFAFVAPAAAQHGLSLSTQADFSTQDRLFVDGETIYIKAEPGADFDLTTVTKSSFELEPSHDGEEYEGTLALQDDGSFTGSVAVSDLEGSSSAWRLKVKIEDEFDHEYEARTAIIIRGRAGHPDAFRISGTVEAASETEITVAGQNIAVTADTELHSQTDVAIADLTGEQVIVSVQKEADESLTALQIFVVGGDRAEHVSFHGAIQAVGDASITVRDIEFAVNDQTVIQSSDGEALSLSDLQARMRVRIEAQRTDEGWIATSITVGAPDRGDDEDREEEEVEGAIEVVGDGFLEVAGLQLLVTEETEFDGFEALTDLEAGMFVEVEFETNEEGALVATKIELEEEDESDEAGEVEVEGLITAIGEATVTVEGVEFVVNEETEIKSDDSDELALTDLSTGLFVKVEGVVVDGTTIAEKIEIEDEEDERRTVLRGEITAVGEGTLTIGETEFQVTDSTEIRGERGAELTFGELEVGMFAVAQLSESTDGTLTAERIKVKRPFEEEDVEVTGRIEAVSETEITVHGQTFAITENTEIEDADGEAVTAADLEAGMIAKVEGELDDAGALVATEIKVRTRLHHEGRFAGLVTALGEGLVAINGVEFTVNAETIFEGATSLADLAVGTRVKIRYRQLGDGTRLALRIEVKTDDEAEAEITGAIESIEGDVIVVAGVHVTLTAATSITDDDDNPATAADLAVGQTVEVKGTAVAEGILASSVKIEEEVVVSGAIDAQTDNTVEIAGFNFAINGETLIVGRNNTELTLEDLKAGAFVEVIADAEAGAGKSGTTLTASRVLLIESSAASTSAEDRAVPLSFTLEQNYPNPFNPATNITFELDATSAGHVSLVIYNMLGQEIATLVDGSLAAGTYTYQWNGRDDAGRSVASGTYLYRLRVGEQIATRSMTLMK